MSALNITARPAETAALPAPKTMLRGALATVVSLVSSFAAATRVTHALQSRRQPATRDLELLGIDPKTHFNV
ncbi:hypothetical protein [Frigidibacter sp. MR17.24]|uniref:hypothetical protein n=1 Tax=Frigidibacter sp. MR17.24 TaxID=3127345 RepID=UPI003012D756